MVATEVGGVPLKPGFEPELEPVVEKLVITVIGFGVATKFKVQVVLRAAVVYGLVLIETGVETPHPETVTE